MGNRCGFGARALAAGVVLGVIALLPLAASAQAPGSVFRDCPDCPAMVVIPAGSFTMGAAPGEEESEGTPQDFRGRSVPQLQIRIAQPLAMGRMHVTRGEFAAFVRESGYAGGNSCVTFEGGQAQDRPGRNWRSVGFEQDDRHPVVCVSWDDAQAYVAWLSRKSGKNYRLPSEAEWEYAARAGTRTRRPWGDSADAGCGHSNINDQTGNRVLRLAPFADCDDGFAYTAPAGTFRANGFGLHDMIGNVWQWTGDCSNANLAGQPGDGAARTSGDCSNRVLRGGAWSVYPRAARSAYRFWLTSTGRFSSVGFRVASTN